MAHRSVAAGRTLGVCLLALALGGVPGTTRADHDPPSSLKIMTFNVWHGLRGERRTRLEGEDPERKERRFEWQVELIEELDPDVLLLQEVNPNARESRKYAEALGYDQIKKVTSCGLHLPPIKIPCNMNDGLTILARPEFDLKKAGKKRLSGNAACTATFGFQTTESRYVLLGEITVDGRPILLATTHLSSPAKVPDDLEAQLVRLIDEGKLTGEQRDEILAKMTSKNERNLNEVEGVLREIDRHRDRRPTGDPYAYLVLTGDLNTEPDTRPIARIGQAGFVNAADDPSFLTFDPVKNHENHAIGSRRTPSLPTFDIEELEEMLAERGADPRQIDYIFVSDGMVPLSARMVMNKERDGIYPSDHFGLIAVVRLDEPGGGN